MDTLNFDGATPTMRRVLDALIEGNPVPPADQAALTDSERNELAALARTATFVRATLKKPEPDEAAQAASLLRAQEALRETGPRVGAALAPDPVERLSWIDRLRAFLGIRLDEEP